MSKFINARIQIEIIKRSLHENILDLNYLFQSKLNALNEHLNFTNSSKRIDFKELKEDVENRTK